MNSAMSSPSSLVGTLPEDSPPLQSIGQWGYLVSTYFPIIQMEIHLILSALFPIIIGAHASLKRPPSSAPPESDDDDSEEDDELEGAVKEEFNAGLTPSDAIIFPITAGLTLGGLYFVIVWLKRADLVNVIMNGYLSIFGVFGVGRLAADALNVITTFIFPTVWSSSKETYYVEPLLLEQASGPIKKARVLTTRKNTEVKANPLPGPLSAIKFSESTNKKLWTLRALLKDHWIFRAYIHGLFKTKFKVTLNDAIGLTLGLTTVILYNTGAKVWWLTNILGINFCYGILQILSPTTFWTGTLVLAGLFAYDIIMVFYTPMMITVAKSLQAPIMLVIPGPSRGSMLGLGDIALPGMVMAMALRFDLYLHYLRKQRIISLDTSNPNSKKEVIKAPYENATGLWGERFWTHRAKSTLTSTSTTETTIADGARFSKIYFKASIVGYIIAMFITMAVMHHFKHGQPALLYLVPGVLGALWGTAAVRGETKLMWEYCEDGEWGFEDRKNKNSEPKSHESEEVGEQNQIAEETHNPKLMAMKGFTAGFGPNGTDTAAQQLRLPNDKSSIPELGKAKEGKVKSSEDEEHSHHVFLFSLSTAQPKKRKGLKVS